jgi:hypothetical protein
MADRKRDDADEQRPKKCYNVRDAWEAPGCFHTNQKELKNKNNKKTVSNTTNENSVVFLFFSTSEIFFISFRF